MYSDKTSDQTSAGKTADNPAFITELDEGIAKICKNKIKGTTILKLAMVKRL